MLQVYEIFRTVANMFVGAIAWGFVLSALAALLVFVPRLIRRALARSLSTADRVAATILMASIVVPLFYVSVPFSEGPYRCTSVLAGAEGRQTVYPDDAPRGTGTLPLLQRRQQVCDDAAKARGVVAGMGFASGLLLSVGVSTTWSRSTLAVGRRESDYAAD